MDEKVNKKALIAGGMSAAMALSGAIGSALADGVFQGEGEASAIEASARVQGGSAVVRADASAGVFSYDQSTVTPNADIAATFRGATQALCNATDDFVQVNPLEWQLSVTGDVDEGFCAPVDELAAESAVKQTMTCTCGGNPADGRAIVTADVKGIPVAYLLDRAAARAGVNTVTFVSSDGTEVAMPLSFVVAHHAVISYEVNGEDLSASVGGNNQLWLTGTSANYFVRDVVEVRVTAEKEVPPAPGEGVDYPNSPNVGIIGTNVA